MPLLEEESRLVQTIDLRDLYPISFRYIFRRSFYWLLISAAVIGIVAFIEWQLPIESVRRPIHDVIGALNRSALYITLILLLGKMVYEIAYFMLYYYAIELEHVVISRGVLLKTRGSFPIAKMSDIHLNRGVIDMLFGLYDLRILTPSPLASLGAIEGLNASNAVGLQNHILALIETTLPKVNEVAAGELMGTPPGNTAEVEVLHQSEEKSETPPPASPPSEPI